MKILLTGGSGFIGSSLAPVLVERGHEVVMLERYVTARYVLGKRQNYETHIADIRDHNNIKEIVEKVQPEAVIHLAAVSPVSYSYERPNEVMGINYLGTVNLAESCRELPHFKQFLFASTSETYGNVDTPITEESPQLPISPYAVSKLASEKYLCYMMEAYNFPVSILRSFNTYGRTDNSHFVMERTIVQMLQGQNIRLGDPTPVRDFMYVDSHVDGYLACLGNEAAIGDYFNFCTGKGISIKNLVAIIAKLTDFNGEIEWNTIPPRPVDIKILIGDYSKTKRILSWEPRVSLEDGLRLSIEHWRNVYV